LLVHEREQLRDRRLGAGYCNKKKAKEESMDRIFGMYNGIDYNNNNYHGTRM
jgi:hypothetical protein